MANFKNYLINDKEYTRVSSILACLPKPWKDNYIKSKAMESLWDMVNTSGPINSVQPDPCSKCGGKGRKYMGKIRGWVTCLYCEGGRDLGQIVPNIEKSDLKYCLDASDRHGKDAAEQGSEVHSAIEVFHKLWDDDIESYIYFLVDFVPDLAWSVDTYANFLTLYNIKVIESEQTVHYDGDTPYAGTLDLIAEMDGELWIGDIKTYESKVSWKAYKKCPECNGSGTDWEDVNQLDKERDCQECSGTGILGKKASAVADTKEELIRRIKDGRFKNPELKIPRNYILEEVVEPPMVKKDHLIQTEAYRRAYNQKVLSRALGIKSVTEPVQESFSKSEIKNRFILYLDRRDRSNYFLYKIDPSTSEEHWSLFCSAYDIFKNY